MIWVLDNLSLGNMGRNVSCSVSREIWHLMLDELEEYPNLVETFNGYEYDIGVCSGPQTLLQDPLGLNWTYGVVHFYPKK